MKRQYMRTRQLQPGMKLDHPAVDRLGRNLVARGAELDQYMIDSMIQLGIMTVYVQLGEEDAANERKDFPEGGKKHRKIPHGRPFQGYALRQRKTACFRRHPVHIQQYRFPGNGVCNRQHCK